MSLNNKSDMSTGGSDGSPFPTGPRGTAFIERPGSFRESIANRIQSSALGTTRSSAMSAHGDPVGLVQSIISDVKPVVSDQKLPRPTDIKRMVGSIVGNSSDEPVLGKHGDVYPEEVRRARAKIVENSNKAEERAKILGEAVSRIDKYLNNNPRKRSRADLSSNERSGGTSSGAGVSRVGPQGHSSNADESEMGPPKAERTKNPGQNRRARTSIAEMDARNLGTTRSSGPVDKTRDVSKITNRSSGEDKGQGLAAGNSWEKPKMKKKRSVIKTDASSSIGLTRSLDGDRERKQGVLPKLGGDARAKATGPHGSRYVVSIAAGGSSGKLDIDQGGLESRRPLPRGGQDGGGLSVNKRERMGVFENGNLKAINKLTDQEGSQATSISRANTSIRGPRSTPATLPKASGSIFRTPPDSDDWDHPSPGNKSGSSAGGTASSKRKSAQSPSPPVTQWGGQRPPKMSRIARRSNLVPIISSQDGRPQMPDSLENSTMPVPSQVRHRIKKGDHGQSSSEESGAAVQKLKDNKRRRAVDMEENNGPNPQRMGTAGHHLKKNKSVMEDDIGEVPVRKQGRGGRGFAPPRPGRPSMVEKPEASGTTTKQRSARSGKEGRPGRPPVKKFSERKSNPRARDIAIDSPVDSSVQPEDDREELLAAANAALAPGYASTDALWKKNEPYFRFLSDEDISFLSKELARMEEPIRNRKADEGNCAKKGNLDYVSLPSTPNGHCPFSNGEETGIVAWQSDAVEPILEQLVQGMDDGPGAGSDTRSLTSFSICQKLMSAIISEEEIDMMECNNGHESNLLNLELQEGWLAPQEPERNCHRNGVRLDVVPLDCPYEQMSVNNRILLELSQIGIYPDPCEDVPDLALIDDNDVNEELAMLEVRLAKQALGMKASLLKAEQEARPAKETQERDFSQLALDKLLVKANEKYVTSHGKHTNRAAKHSAMGFINRALTRCKDFESNGTSCFDELSFKELLQYSISKRSDPTRNEDKSPQDPLMDKDEQWSTGVKKKELLLDDVVGNITGAVSLSRGPKGKRSERETKGNNKNGHGSSSSNPKGSRKPKAKPKRGASTSTLLSNGDTELAPRSNNKREGLPPLPSKPGSKQKGKEKKEEEEEEALPDLSGLQLPDIDTVGDFSGNGQGDLSDLLDMDGDGLQEIDCMGLDIPLDDLHDVVF